MSRGAFVSTFLVASAANAGNLDAFYLSGSAPLLAGAVTATSEGGGAIWYNPAGLASIGGGRADVTVSGYAVRFGGSPELSGGPGATVQNLGRLDLNVVPTALSITQRFGPVGLGFGIFVPSQGTQLMRTLVKEQTSDGSTEFAVDAYQRTQSYHAGPAIGYSPSDRIDLGMSLLANYQTALQMGTMSVNGVLPGGVYAANEHTLSDGIQIGLELVFGMKWKPTDDWRVGFTVRTPAVRLAQILQEIETTSVAGTGTDPDTRSVYTDDFGLAAAVISPFRFHWGVARSFKEYLFSGDMSVQLPFIDEKFDVRGRATWNGRLGAKRELNSKVAIGGGLFTDLSTSEAPASFGDSQINYYGITFAADFKTPYYLSGKGDETFEKPRPMIFGTTIGLSYALGVGSVMSAVARYDGTDGIKFEPLLTNVIAHEITVHVGSTVME